MSTIEFVAALVALILTAGFIRWSGYSLQALLGLTAVLVVSLIAFAFVKAAGYVAMVVFPLIVFIYWPLWPAGWDD